MKSSQYLILALLSVVIFASGPALSQEVGGFGAAEAGGLGAAEAGGFEGMSAFRGGAASEWAGGVRGTGSSEANPGGMSEIASLIARLSEQTPKAAAVLEARMLAAEAMTRAVRVGPEFELVNKYGNIVGKIAGEGYEGKLFDNAGQMTAALRRVGNKIYFIEPNSTQAVTYIEWNSQGIPCLYAINKSGAYDFVKALGPIGSPGQIKVGESTDGKRINSTAPSPSAESFVGNSISKPLTETPYVGYARPWSAASSSQGLNEKHDAYSGRSAVDCPYCRRQLIFSGSTIPSHFICPNCGHHIAKSDFR